MFDMIALLLERMETWALAGILVFARVGAVIGLLPGLGETFIPARIRLMAALTLSVIALPAIDSSALPAAMPLPVFTRFLLAEAAIGLAIGLSTRLIVHALQLAGTIAAQSTALAQVAGPGVAPDPMPAIGNTLMIAGVTLAMVLDVHVRLVVAVVESYDTLGFGALMSGAELGAWGLDQATAAFALGFTLAAPFVIAALLYNLALGAINRAMPQLMVAFVGAPAITGLTLLLLLLSAPLILTVWVDHLNATLAAPLEFRR